MIFSNPVSRATISASITYTYDKYTYDDDDVNCIYYRVL